MAHGPDEERDFAPFNLSYFLIAVSGGFSTLVLFWHLFSASHRYIRLMAGLNDPVQRFFTIPNPRMSFLKDSIAYAPIFKRRHNSEFRLSSAINMGTLPTRLELIFLLGYLTTNLVFCFHDLDFKNDTTAALKGLRAKSGALSVANMVPLFILASRNNPLISWLGMSFDSFNLIHRWFGRIVAFEALLHTVAHFVSKVVPVDTGLQKAFGAIANSSFIFWGFMGTLAFTLICIQAASPLRHAFYETFKILHIGLAILSVVGVYFHCKANNLPEMKYLIAACVFWGYDRLMRCARLVYFNVGKGMSEMQVTALPSEAVRVSIKMVRPWKFRPGQHAYMYVPALSVLQSHPFTVAWSENVEVSGKEQLPVHRKEKVAMSFVIRARTGFTDTLYKKAVSSKHGVYSSKCMLEGPYGHEQSLDSYGTVVMFAGGVGITHHVPYVRQLVTDYANGITATRKVLLVWIVRNLEDLEWVRPWMTEILALPQRREILRIKLFITRPTSHNELKSPSATVQMLPGRPNIKTIVENEVFQQVGAMAVSVCGPGALGDEVRSAVREYQYDSVIDLMEEAFTW